MWKTLISPKVLGAAWAVTIAAAMFFTWQYRAAICEATVSGLRLDALAAIEKAERDAAAVADKHELAMGRLRKQLDEVSREAQKVVERPDYRDCRLDDDGVRILRQARGDAGEPDSPLP